MSASSDPIVVFEGVLKTLASKNSSNKKLEACVVLLNLEIPFELCCLDRFQKICAGAIDLVRSFLGGNPGLLARTTAAEILENIYKWKSAKKRAAGAIDYIDLATGEVSVKLSSEQEAKNQKNTQKARSGRKRSTHVSTRPKKFRKKDQKVPKPAQQGKASAHSIQPEEDLELIIINEGAGNAREQLRKKHMSPPAQEPPQQNDTDPDIEYLETVPKKSLAEKDSAVQESTQMAQATPEGNLNVAKTPLHQASSSPSLPSCAALNHPMPVHQKTNSFIAPKLVSNAAPQTKTNQASDEDEAALLEFLDGSYSEKFDQEHGYPRIEPVFESPSRPTEQISMPSSASNQFYKAFPASVLQTPRHMFDYQESTLVQPALSPVPLPLNPKPQEAVLIAPSHKPTLAQSVYSEWSADMPDI